MIRTATVTINGISPYSQSRHYADDVPRGKDETPDDYERRTWRNRLHVTADGFVQTPPGAFKNGIAEAAKFNPRKLKGTATYTKFFESGILVLNPLVLPIKAADVAGEWLFVPSDGRRGGSKRVSRCFPMIPAGQWGGDVEFSVVSGQINEEVFEDTMRDFGMFIGIGRFRPKNNGFYGRFEVSKIKWS